MRLFRKLRDPVMFQGSLGKKQYFEGWYYKLVDRGGGNIYAVIPGISLDRRGGSSHAFIQVIDGKTARTEHVSYPLSAFWSADAHFHVRIGGSSFEAQRLALDIGGGEFNIKGELLFEEPAPWPARALAPGVMGWYSYAPFMECYHGLVSMNHGIRGALEINGTAIDFSGGKGYGEKDCGRSFPAGYVWMQTNHFRSEGISFMASIAKIPWLGGHFTGFLALLWQKGTMKAFTTYNGARISSLAIAPGEVRMTLTDKQHRLEVTAARSADARSGKSSGGVLTSPAQGAMTGRIVEELTSSVRLKLYALKGDEEFPVLLLDDLGSHAGLEVEATAELLGF